MTALPHAARSDAVSCEQVRDGVDGAQRSGTRRAGELRELDDGGEQHVQFERLAALQVLEGGGLVVADAFGAGQAPFDGDAGAGSRGASATASVSCIIVATSSRVSRWRQICAIVARERALIGLKAMLPSSLIQMSLRRSGSTGHLRPPATIASLKARQRAETLRVGLADGEAGAFQVPDDSRAPSSSVAA